MAATPSPAGVPDTMAGWKAVAGSLLTEVSCAFHRNLEISTQYAWIYKRAPACMKWAGMAAIASHHVRRALFPLRLDSDRTGYVDIPRSLGRHKSLLIRDVNTIRETNNAIFDDIFWAHLAYLSADDGLDRLRDLLRDEVHYAPVLSGFESIDRGRRVLEDATSTADSRLMAEQLIWNGNVQLLEHEQRALVQPQFDHLSCAFARLVSMGSTTTFEVHGVRQEARLLHLVLRLLARRTDSARLSCEGVAEDHRLRRPLELDRHERRPPVPEARRSPALDRRQPATHLRRGARLLVDALRRAPFTADRSCPGRRRSLLSQCADVQAPAGMIHEGCSVADGEHNPSHCLTRGEVSQRLGRLRQRERPVDHDAELAGLEELGQRGHQRALVR